MKIFNNKFSWLCFLASLAVLFIIIFTGHDAQATTLPTTWTPKINLTTSQRAVWAQMKADYDANPANPATLGGQLYKAYQTNALCNCRYADDGFMAANLYQITGDTKFAAAAWTVIANGFISMPNADAKGDMARESFIEEVTLFDWLYPALTPDQRQQFFDKINVMATNEVTNPYSVENPIRTSDSDQTIGDYYGMALWYLLTKDFNPTIVNIWALPEIGGFQATGNNQNTLRNAISFYATQLGAGGEWMESSMYNIGTEDLLLMGDQGMKSLTGVDYYPEVTALIPLFAERQLSVMTDDLNQSIQWGDEQNPRQEQYFYVERLNAMLAGLTKGTPVGMALQDLTLDLIAKNPADHDGLDTALASRYMYFFDPYAPRGDRTTGFFTQYAPGMGTEYYHDGRGPLDSLFFAQSPKSARVDHTPYYLGDFQLYRQGEWAITHPLTYAGSSVSGHGGTNSMVIGGVPFHFWEFGQFHQPLQQEFGTIGSQPYAYLVSAEGGQIAGSGSWNPPPTFLHEHSRSLVYLPSATKNVDTIIVYDRVNAQDPKSLPGFSGYDKDLASQMSIEPNNKEWFINTSTAPSVTDSTITWSTAQSNMKVNVLLPASHTATVINQAIDWPAGSVDAGYMEQSEKKYSVRISPSTSEQWDTFLNVVQAANPGVSTTNTLVKSTGGEAEGVVVARPGQNDVIVIFNARPSANLPTLNGKDNPYNPAVQDILASDHFTNGGYTVKFNIGTPSASVLLSDLTNASLWSASIDGGTTQNLSVDSQGIGQLNINGAGSHTVALTSSINPNPPPIQPPETTTITQNSTKFVSGDRVATTTSNVNVRSAAALTGTLLGTQPARALGTVVSGGTYADGYYWWNINYDTGADGWSAENFLTKYVVAVPPPTTPATTLSSLRITPASATLGYGQSQQFTATATWGDGSVTAPPVVWSGHCGTITTTGLYTAGSNCGAMTISVSATLNGMTASAPVTLQAQSVTITPPPTPSIITPLITPIPTTHNSTPVTTAPATLTKLQIAPTTATLSFGQSQQFTVTATWSDGSTTSPAATWGGHCGTVTSTGLYTAGSNCGAVTISVWATFSGVTSSASVTLRAPGTTANVLSSQLSVPLIIILLGILTAIGMAIRRKS